MAVKIIASKLKKRLNILKRTGGVKTVAFIMNTITQYSFLARSWEFFALHWLFLVL